MILLNGFRQQNVFIGFTQRMAARSLQADSCASCLPAAAVFDDYVDANTMEGFNNSHHLPFPALQRACPSNCRSLNHAGDSPRGSRGVST